MLLDNNTKKVINLINNFDTLNNIDKLRLSIYILENKNFDVNFNTRDIIILLKKILSNLDSNYRKTIINFSGYKHLLFCSAKYLELSNMEKKNFTVEMLFNIYEIDFNDETINNKINNYLLIYDYCYAVLNRLKKPMVQYTIEVFLFKFLLSIKHFYQLFHSPFFHMFSFFSKTYFLFAKNYHQYNHIQLFLF